MSVSSFLRSLISALNTQRTHFPIEARITTRRESFLLFGSALAIIMGLAIILTILLG